jgi:Zn-dependent protease
MDSHQIIDILIIYIGLVVLLTFHEFGHAWMALKCGDDTAKNEGRVSLNPLVHIDPIGTVILPLAGLFLAMRGSAFAGLLIGWAKPVPVNISNLRNPKLDDILVTMAGPWMNLLLAVLLVGLARIGVAVHSTAMHDVCLAAARLSLFLCFFNLVPIPPLDGSHVVRILIGMSYETYLQIARFGIILILLVFNLTALPELLRAVTAASIQIMEGWFGL